MKNSEVAIINKNKIFEFLDRKGRMILVLLMNALSAFILVASKPLLSYVDPLMMISIRLLGASFLLMLYYFIWKVSQIRLSRPYLVALLVLGIANGYAVNLFQLMGLSYISPVHASLWANSTPFVVALINYVIYRHTPSFLKIAALCLGWLGFIPLLWGVPTHSLLHYLYGAGYFLAGAVMTAISSLILEKNKSVAYYPMVLTNGILMAIGGLCAFIHYFLFSPRTPMGIISLTTQQLALLGLLIPITLLSAIFYFYFIKKYGSLLVTFAGFSLPIFSALFEYIWKGTVQITPQLLLSTGLISLALFLFTRD